MGAAVVVALEKCHPVQPDTRHQATILTIPAQTEERRGEELRPERNQSAAGASRLWPTRKIDKIGQDIQRLVSLRVERRFLRLPVVTVSEQVRLVIGGSFGSDLH